jgi:nucleotide-binding universal stress UspA family protein
MERILVGTDTSGRAEAAVRTAADLALAEGAELVILHVHVRPRSPEGLLDPHKAVDPEEYLGDVVRRLPDLRARIRVEEGDPASRICEVADDEGADLIVVGNLGVHGRGHRVLGSVPVAVLRRAAGSVLVVDTRAAG